MKPRTATFVVRLTQCDGGNWGAVIEQVKTGEKFRPASVEEIGRLIETLAAKQVTVEGVTS